MPVNLTLPLSVTLALLHVSAGKLLLLDRIPRRYLLSVSGGVAIGYVFIEILPSLSEAQESIAGVERPLAYLLSLLGLVVFYALELKASRSRNAQIVTIAEGATRVSLFWLHIASFAIYNALFSLLLTRMATPLNYLLLFIAVAMHYVGNDHHLREHHKQEYDRIGRWILAGAILFGWATGELISRSSGAMAAGSPGISLLEAFLAGGVILNVLKSELPGRGEQSFQAFVAGAATYAIVLLLL